MDLSLKIDKIPVLIKKEVEGFLLNRIFKVIGREALCMLEMGIASIEDIDKACVYGAGHPMGPFRLMDLTGIDLNYIRSMERFRETGGRADLPSPSVVEKYTQARYGERRARAGTITPKNNRFFSSRRAAGFGPAAPFSNITFPSSFVFS